MATLQGSLQFLHPLLTLIFRQAKFHEPEMFPSGAIFEPIPPSTLQNLDDSFSDDEGLSLGKSVYPDCLAEWVRDRAEV
jgi:hypothetical protein